MNAFAAAVTRIFTDPHMAVDATWLPGGVPPGSTIRAIRKAPDEVTSYGGARIWSETLRIDVMAAETPSIQPGDRIVIGVETFEVQGEPIRDRERLVVTLDLRPV
ncbi:hypothetical protein SAMN04488021_1376 [Paracoccus aminovorans]|uniref:Head-tail adaptor n=1 Tax=Paracoccus aminovorans TaxID=34004 RepID=A0A1I3DAL9_9RHOB|nr:hypothetical protein [Paracoccus aminovorans]CQR84722.1 hypothetical protein JCM7685_0129 [Paracoccus aminovorans]SFH83764.1 hypothetical protein SAMN04488021_1376 [Paracoccus aminovorans]